MTESMKKERRGRNASADNSGTAAIGRYANVLLDDWYSKTFPRDSLFFIFF